MSKGKPPDLLRGLPQGHDICGLNHFIRYTELCDFDGEPDTGALVDLDLTNPDICDVGLSPGHLDRLIQGNDFRTGTSSQGHRLPMGEFTI